MNIEKEELEFLSQKYFDKSFVDDWVGISGVASFYSLFSDKKLHKVLEEDFDYIQLSSLHCIHLGDKKQLKLKCIHSLKSLFLKIGFAVNEQFAIDNWAK